MKEAPTRQWDIFLILTRIRCNRKMDKRKQLKNYRSEHYIKRQITLHFIQEPQYYANLLLCFHLFNFPASLCACNFLILFFLVIHVQNFTWFVGFFFSADSENVLKGVKNRDELQESIFSSPKCGVSLSSSSSSSCFQFLLNCLYQ